MALAVIASIVRLFIAVHTPMVANMSQLSDDAYFVNLASSIVQGNWLGEYDSFLLQKVPGYAFVLASCLAIGLPYQLLFCLLEIGAAIILLIALRPLNIGQTASCIIYVFLIFSPDLFTWAFFQRTYRMGTLIPFIESLFACYIAIWLRPNSERMLGWIVLMCLTMPALFLVKEDSIWIVPFAAAASIGIIVKRTIVHKKGHWGKRALLCATALVAPFVVSYVCLSAVSLINLNNYGIYSYSDRYDSAISDVCADLVRIKPNDDVSSNVWVSQDAIEQAYEASPTLSSVKDEMTNARKYWAEFGPASDPIIDHSFWAIKTTMEAVPELSNAPAAERFFSVVHSELSEAFAEGRLEAKEGLWISSTVEPIPWDKVPTQILTTLRIMANFYNGDELLACTAPSAVSDGDLSMQRKASILINGPLVFSEPGDPETRIGNVFQGISYKWVKVCVDAMPFIFWLFLAMLATLMVALVKRKRMAFSVLVVAFGIALTQMVVVFSVSWFCAGLGDTANWATAMYCAPFYPLYETSFVMVLGYLIGLFRTARQRRSGLRLNS